MCLEHQIESTRCGQRSRRGRARREDFRAQRFVIQCARHGNGANLFAGVVLLDGRDPFPMRFEQLDVVRLADFARRREQNPVVGSHTAICRHELEREHGELIRPIPRAGLSVVHHGVAEAADVAARLPYLRVHQQRAVQPHHAEGRWGARYALRLVVMSDHVVPPCLLEVAFEFHAERAIIPRSVQAAVDLARREYEAPPFAQRDNFLH